VSETPANAAKHSGASRVRVEVVASGHVLRISVADDGVGGADPGRGSGLIGLGDRLETLNGRLQVSSPSGGGTRVQAELPLG
jgi:signal transduction histidine kinase